MKSRIKLTALKPRLLELSSRVPTLTSTAKAQRVRGRAAVKNRARLLSENPLCRICEARGRVRAATEVDHVVPLSKGGADTDDNKQNLCSECHKEKTAQDMGYRTKRRTGTDGWPV